MSKETLKVGILSVNSGLTFCAAARAGIPAILAEAGGQGIWTRNDVALHTDGLHRLMRHLAIDSWRRS